MAVYDTEVTEKIENKLKSSAVSQERDEYFEAAARFVIEKDKASHWNLCGECLRLDLIDVKNSGSTWVRESWVRKKNKAAKALMSSEQLESYFEEYL